MLLFVYCNFSYDYHYPIKQKLFTRALISIANKYKKKKKNKQKYAIRNNLIKLINYINGT